ncbi:MAG: hypothetical protein JW778_04820 [Candidatus Altiarchaeota archaeon]|nr:hypothetical protein [Candidatus Altiarchaeota archaeon]
MRYSTISDEEIHEIKKMYESIMSKSSHGLFHSTGKIIGQHIIKEITDRDRFFEEASRILKDRDIVRDISFEEKTITVRGSIEVTTSESNTCDILRGIIAALYRGYYDKKIYCEEKECESKGADACRFEIMEEVV